MTFREWITAKIGDWSTEREWCEKVRTAAYVSPRDLAALARVYCRERPGDAAVDLYALPADVVAEISAEAVADVHLSHAAAMTRLYGSGVA